MIIIKIKIPQWEDITKWFATLRDLELHLRELMKKETDEIKSVMYKLK